MDLPALDPYVPLNILKPVDTDIWIVDGPEITFGYLGLRLPFSTRMTVVRLPDGGLWLHSPIEPSDALFAAIDAMGPVRFLVAPNTIHYWWIADWKGRFPQADVHGVAGLDVSAKRATPIEYVLGAEMPPWSETIDQVLVRGDLLTEMDFFHRPSRTLILTDLIENFELSRIHRRCLRVLVKLGGSSHPDGKPPLDMRLQFLRHRRALRAAVLQMLAWQPQRIIIAHGRCYQADAVVELKRAFRWLI